ncbi:hypothetical protein K5X82_10100 [Halosquirtibacter xylanolyticus]|uniref:hypothetical protein n=1 Tax=Halosquirtibacter xylanolyticus TaxID=3374599 RepID=UPI00374A421B|nr:hypothetical protein K5X82_10100 [Prolixibacteraceae bacterium]
MSINNVIRRHHAIVDMLWIKPASFKEIYSKLNYQSKLSGVELTTSLRTFGRDIIDIHELYGIKINYDHIEKRYYIHQNNILGNEERLFDAMRLKKVLHLNDNYASLIHLEHEELFNTVIFKTIIRSLIKPSNLKVTSSQSITIGTPVSLIAFETEWYLMVLTSHTDRIISISVREIHELEIFALQTAHQTAAKDRWDKFVKDLLDVFDNHHFSELCFTETENGQQHRYSIESKHAKEWISYLLTYKQTITIDQPLALKEIYHSNLICDKWTL